MFPDFSQIGTVADTLATGVRDIDSRLEQISNQLNQLIVATVISGLPPEDRDNPAAIEDTLSIANIYLLHHSDKMRRDRAVISTREYDPSIDMAHPNGGGETS